MGSLADWRAGRGHRNWARRRARCGAEARPAGEVRDTNPGGAIPQVGPFPPTELRDTGPSNAMRPRGP